PAAAQALAKMLAERAPVAMRYAKEAVVKGLGMSLEDGLRLENDLATLLRTTEDRIEGAKAFLEKRKPRFTGQEGRRAPTTDPSPDGSRRSTEKVTRSSRSGWKIRRRSIPRSRPSRPR